MKYLLDTHIILWALIDDNRLNERAKKIIMDSNNTIYYSTVSPWEVEIKHLKDKNFKLTGEQFCFLCNQNHILNLSIQNEHIIELKSLESTKKIKHNDPFDKMLLAQAKYEKMVFITHDKKFEIYTDKNIMIV